MPLEVLSSTALQDQLACSCFAHKVQKRKVVAARAARTARAVSSQELTQPQQADGDIFDGDQRAS